MFSSPKTAFAAQYSGQNHLQNDKYLYLYPANTTTSINLSGIYNEMNMKNILLLLISCWYSWSIMAQTTTWKGKHWEARISDNGCLEQIVFKNNEKNDTVPFFLKEGQFTGPSFYAVYDGKTTNAAWVPDGYLSYRTAIDHVECRMTYCDWKGQPTLEITLTNLGHVPFQPEKAGLRLGIDTYMDKYPDWFGKYFPTLMRNEKSHFFGYLQTPSGHMLGIVSPQPVASWSVEYNLGYQDPAPHWFMGHRIESLNLDLLNALPLPGHHPQDLWCLKQGESRTWNIAFVDMEQPDALEEKLHRLADIPMLRIPQTTCCPGERISFDVMPGNAEITVCDRRGERLDLTTEKISGDLQRVSCVLPETGLYTIHATDGEKQAEGIVSAHASWEWTLEQARRGAWKYHQKATSHIESWYGFYSAFLAAQYFPDRELDRKLRHRFDYLFTLLHDTTKMVPKYYESRIQNTSGTINLLVHKYHAYNDTEDLRKASRLADWLINTWQRKDGAYVNHHIVYTSVIYVAKNILELALTEYGLGTDNPEWKRAADRHYDSAKRAIDQLVASQGNFETEGELTFEDGMISCSALQIGMLGLMQRDSRTRDHYTAAMLKILESHDCLTQLRVPDARRRGGTMRYWEAQYDVQMLPNMFNSPHGWSGWRAYATYYAYLLTGNERWLQETYNAMGAFSNLIDCHTGDLRWAFVADPYLKVKQTCSADTRASADSLSFGNPHPELYDTRRFIIGEQYVNMISDWQTVNTQDNDVHEVFKFMGEAMLTNAFVVERQDGTVAGYNCRVTRQGNTLYVEADEKQMVNLHCNLQHAYKIRFRGQTRETTPGYRGWCFGKDIYLPE